MIENVEVLSGVLDHMKKKDEHQPLTGAMSTGWCQDEHQSLTGVKNKRDHKPGCVKCQDIFSAGVELRCSLRSDDAMARRHFVRQIIFGVSPYLAILVNQKIILHQPSIADNLKA